MWSTAAIIGYILFHKEFFEVLESLLLSFLPCNYIMHSFHCRFVQDVVHFDVACLLLPTYFKLT